MTEEITLALKAMGVFIFGLYSIWQVVFDKKDDRRAAYLTVASVIVIILGILVMFKEASLGLVVFGIGSIALIMSSTTELKQQCELENGEISSGLADFFFAFFGIICIAGAIVGYRLALPGFLEGFLIVLAVITFLFAFVAKTVKIAYVLAIAIILILLAISSVFL
ncbi:MAG: hypothetical protein WC788_00665 [Candidatus Paceibacterota bacterium]|jgi:hypothetical protein